MSEPTHLTFQGKWLEACLVTERHRFSDDEWEEHCRLLAFVDDDDMRAVDMHAGELTINELEELIEEGNCQCMTDVWVTIHGWCEDKLLDIARRRARMKNPLKFLTDPLPEDLQEAASRERIDSLVAARVVAIVCKGGQLADVDDFLLNCGRVTQDEREFITETLHEAIYS